MEEQLGRGPASAARKSLRQRGEEWFEGGGAGGGNDEVVPDGRLVVADRDHDATLWGRNARGGNRRVERRQVRIGHEVARGGERLLLEKGGARDFHLAERKPEAHLAEHDERLPPPAKDTDRRRASGCMGVRNNLRNNLRETPFINKL